MAEKPSTNQYSANRTTSKAMKSKTKRDISKKQSKNLEEDIKTAITGESATIHPDNSPMSDYDIVDKSEVEEQLTLNSTIKNLCIGCRVDMGPDNPRQYCRKTYCPYE